MKVFIIAGIGDHTRYIRHRVKNWPEDFGIEPIPLRFGWRGDYQENYKLLKQNILDLSGGEKCTIIGISAGASAALRLKSELDGIICAVTICGRTSRGGFSIKRFSKYPAYWKSVDMLDTHIARKDTLVISPIFDELVAVNHMSVKSSEVLKVPYLLHIPSIILTLSRQADAIVSFVKISAVKSEGS